MQIPDDDFGDGDTSTESAVVPYGRFKPDPGIREAWERERERTKSAFVSPLDALTALQKKRKLPTLPLPPAWTDFASRARLYAGEVMAVSGPTGGGKTSFAIEIARACVGQGIPVLWLPKELDPPEVDLRIVANSAKTHVRKIREEWHDEDIARVLIAIEDRWRYVDYYRDPTKQLDACERAIESALRVYGRPPLFVCDYVGKFSRGDRGELADVIERIREFTVDLTCFTMLLSQTSRANDQKLTGKVDMDSAAEAIGVSAETGELEHASSVSIALNVFKADDAMALDAHVLTAKARGTGREGRTGFQFLKPGGQWVELPFIPATPSEVTVEINRQKKDKHRVVAVAEPVEARRDINVMKQDRAETLRRESILGALRAAGIDGASARELKKHPRLTNWKTTRASLDVLLSRSEIEQRSDGRWRILNQTTF